MATVAGGDHNTASSNTATTTWADAKDFCLLSERNQRAEVPPKQKKFGKMLSFSQSSSDLRHSVTDKNRRDGSSPTGVIEACLNDFESGSGSAEPADKEPEVENSNVRAHSNWSRFFKLWKRRSIKRLTSFTPLPVPNVPTRKSRSTRENPELRDLFKFKSSLKDFSLAELETASNNFSRDNIIGKGGFAEVYKGRLQNGKLVAIKRLSKGTADEKTTVFLSELGIMAHVDHPNTAKLLGCGIEGGMHLVFELSPLGSLGSVLHGTKGVELDWSKRYKIALGSAEGLLYLHENCRKRIIHRDIKADNILLTEDFEPQICDFGLAKWLPRQWTHRNVSKFEGTFGYFAPEYFMHGIVDEKTDTYAMGVLLLELITGRPALDHLQQSLVIWAKPLLDNNDIKELADPSLGDHYDIEEMERVILTASLCIEQSPILRPRMNQVVILLRGDEYVRECAKENQRKTLQRTYSEELLDAQEYNSTKYLNDLKRHKELALGC
ncbi:receptor-like cytosolic serine/threonine-protein kinase RBK2 isoform X2 [Ricinus communis]|uniref:receptor-like cytosolic serine/threonine-protein kinase RBK2 isoform X2 n=1 Tax=Ricinus communis TaxID=3988 RepID=UPI0007722565|nr:receptor-like cytosolic serine/threonine-protein kinase RBK2 isoform X2 [Ricinus communis]|eukprot:XP_015570421.1 receptor-like cytosolic serine/threonine-protein kinase RBK2 isoform X2 [Ricinus communis]